MRKLKLHEVRILVVDEVDQVFQLGEQSEIELIMKRTSAIGTDLRFRHDAG